jgi:hypothetical protein
MAHFAKLDENNVVLEVIVVNNETLQNLPFPESEPIGVAFCQSLFGADTVWKQTSYNNNFRGIYAGIGFTYDPAIDEFVAPVPPEPPVPESEIYDEVTP